MSRILLLFLFTEAFAFSAIAQNLVPNPSFETYTGCPAGNSAISNGFVPSWNRPPGSIITPDIFTPCTSSGASCSDFNVANNCVGSSVPFHATAYAGYLWYYTGCPNCKEYIVAQLTSPCIGGTLYRASYRTKLGPLCRYGTDRHGMYISATAPSQPGGNQPILITPTVQRVGQVLDKVSWTPISGTFTAVGTENYVTIGNFFNDASTSIFNFGSSAGSCIFATGAAYYYIDSVQVRPAVILPVTIHNFEGEAHSNGDQLRWQVAPATELGELWLEHSVDGQHFTEIANWRSPSPERLTSNFLHEAPSDGVNFYRLGMADRNGEFMVSEVVALRRGSPETIRLQLQPNPSDGQAQLSFTLPKDADAYVLTITAMTGAIVLRDQVSNANLISEYMISTASLEAGVYSIEVSSGGKRGIQRLVVVH